MKRLAMMMAVMVMGTSGAVSADAASLYHLGSSPFSTNIAQKVGDVLTIIVEESSTTEDNGTANLKKSSDISAELQALFIPGINPAKGFTATAGGGDSPKFAFGNSSEQKGNASNTATHSIKTYLQVRMIEQINEDQFVVRGERTVFINGKMKKVFISGVLRQNDIADDNTVSSNKLAEARIEIEGDVNKRDLKPGVISELFNKVF